MLRKRLLQLDPVMLATAALVIAALIALVITLSSGG
jgi:hypothetical protein